MTTDTNKRALLRLAAAAALGASVLAACGKK